MSYYIQRGFAPEYLLSMSLAQRLFFAASMQAEEERQGKILEAFLGAGFK